MVLRVLLLLFGVSACATAVIMIKTRPASMHPVLLASYRLFVAAVALTPLLVRDWRRRRGQVRLGDLKVALLPGAMLGLHFVTWIIGAEKPPAANVSLIVNMVPIVMPFFLFVLIRERLTKAELLATVIAMAGLAVLGAKDFDSSREFFIGDAICFASMLLYAFYLALGRKYRRFGSIWLYLVPLYYVAAVFCLLGALPFTNPIRAYSLHEVLLAVGLGLVPTVIGHSILNYSMRHIRGQVVSLINLSQFVFAGIMGYAFYSEVPNWSLFVAAAGVVAGAVLVLRSQARSARDVCPRSRS